MDMLADIRTARAAIGPHIHHTPLWRSSTLSRMLGRDVHIKAELLQKTGSYKPRGMIWALMSLSDAQRAAGAITFSAGNAAQGLAYAGAVLGVTTVVVMAATANPTKVQATKDYGAEVILHGTPQEAAQHCLDVAAARGLTYVSSYDDEALMTGHASLGCEIFEALPDAAAIFLGIGGGGMAGGLAKAAMALDRPAELFGVEPTGAPAMVRSLQAGHAVRLQAVKTVADGLAAPSAGERCFHYVKQRFSDVVLVEDDAILAAMKLLMQRCKLTPEPAGAAALAGLLAHAGRVKGDGPIVCIVSGGNVDLKLLKEWL
ncbi:threonine ammonia-lyase [Labrys monachus]|uniref:Threonine dehydratase n=1 Tax=Labrys monachus TaxID=217067 RepID=A0ABU0F865_9HYPH|nr:threonine/serine dehydratase [Labrys monachus]MDQ0390802.1 threonine dehydratase [Labrys monachus]